MATETGSRLPPELLAAAKDLTVNAAGGLVGAAVAGPVGVVLGAAAGSILGLGADVLQRHLSLRERARVGALLWFAEQKIYENVMLGQSLRDDEYFAASTHARSAAAELAEAAALAAQREAQRPKYGITAS